MGYGGRLLDHLIDFAKDKVDSIFLEVRKGNEKAISMYKSRGFEAIGDEDRGKLAMRLLFRH